MKSSFDHILSTARPIAAGLALLPLAATFAACGGGGGGGVGLGGGAPVTVPPTPEPPQAALLKCDESMKSQFAPDADTKVLLVKSFKAGDPIALAGTPSSPPPAVANKDLCLVKLLVSPGNPGTAGLASTSMGIGMEIWLPAPENWNQRIRNTGGGGWAGGMHTSTNVIANMSPASLAEAGWVSGHTDTGHQSEALYSNGEFAMKEDGSINTVLWQDFSHRSLKELALKTRALARAYYGKPQSYAYWEGCSTGGRQGYKIAQEDPELYDGYLNGAPALNWTRLSTSMVYPSVVMNRDLGRSIPDSKLAFVGSAAVSACNGVGNQKLSFILDPTQCRYDPSKDASVLCNGVSGNGVTGTSTNAACVGLAEAQAVNKIWYGQTPDGSMPDPVLDNASTPLRTSANHLWYGLPRGTMMFSAAPDMGTDNVALELQNPRFAQPSFKNPTGNGANGSLALTYADLAFAYEQGLQLQSYFGNINTDNPDLRNLRNAGSKVLAYHGWTDPAIPAMGTVNYYTRAANVVGGYSELNKFNKLYMIPGYGHCFGVGSLSATNAPPADLNSVPLPAPDQLFNALVDWVEKGVAPGSLELKSANGGVSMPVCPYPQKANYKGSGSVTAASSYSCS